MTNAVRAFGRGILHPLIQRAAQAYVAGSDLPSAMEICRQLSARAMGSTVCFWDDRGNSAEEIADQYRAVIGALGAEGFDAYASIKATALRFSHELTRQVIAAARAAHVPVHFDAMAADSAERTFALIQDLSSEHTELGCTLPGRWRRSVSDAHRLAASPLRIRVVKGQWADPREPRRDPGQGFIEVIDRLAGRSAAVAVASHDPRTARPALEKLLAASTPCELELLYGLPVRRILPLAAELGVPVRFYIPYGHAWLPYALKRVMINPRIACWALRDCFGRRDAPIPQYAPKAAAQRGRTLPGEIRATANRSAPDQSQSGDSGNRTRSVA